MVGRGIREIMERQGWTVWGNQAEADYKPGWATYAYNSGTPDAGFAA